MMTLPATAADGAAPEVERQALRRSGTDLWDRAWGGVVRLLPAEGQARLLWAVLVVAVVTRAVWLARPDGALIFDEKYYVNAARVVLGIAVPTDTYGDRTKGLDPNTEHPPLAKVLVAGSMAILGDNPYGWRLPSVVIGIACILLLYGIAGRLADPAIAATAAALLALDNLAFVHSRIFTLDIFQLGFMLLGLYLYILGRSTLAGVGFALAALAKLGGAFGLVGVLVYELLLLARSERPLHNQLQEAARRLVRVGMTFVLTFMILLSLIDLRWSEYRNPIDHIQRMVSY